MLDAVDTLVLLGFGLILGSFLNALAFRYNSGKSMWGRSACMACNRELEPVDLVPVFSYLFLMGRCRRCKSKISIQYPIVELLAGILTVLSYARGGTPLQFILTLAFFQILLFISIYDIRHTIIPDSFVYTEIGIGALYALSLYGFNIQSVDIYTLFAGPVLAFPLFLVWFFSKGKGMGLGDAKLFLASGWFLGLWAGIAAFILSFWTGAIVGVFLLLMSRGKRSGYKMKSELPFGPFIAIAVALVFFSHIDVFSILFV